MVRLAMVAMVAIALPALAQQNRPQSLTDGKGFSLEFKTVQAEQTTPDRIEARFTGTPLVGRSLEQSLYFESQTLEGTLTRTQDDRLRLREGVVTGNVMVRLGAANANPYHTIRTQRARLRAESNQSVMSVDQAFTLQGRTEAAVPYEITGNGLTALFGPLEQSPPGLRQATIERQAKVTLNTEQGRMGMTSNRAVVTVNNGRPRIEAIGNAVLTNELTQQSTRRRISLSTNRLVAQTDPTLKGSEQLRSVTAPGAVNMTIEWTGGDGRMNIKANGNNLRYDAASRTVTLRNVVTEGIRRADDKISFGELNADVMTIVFNEAGEVVRMRLDAENGEGTFRQEDDPDKP